MVQKFLNTTTHSIAWFEKRSRAGELQLKAPFQRNPVWTPKQKSYLIDSILRGYPIPELYMQEFTDAHGNENYVVVDGQQRLRACLEFIDGVYSLDEQDSPEWADMLFDDLGEEQKKTIYNYQFVVRVLPEMGEEELRAMFQRLNRNVVALNRQELRHATYWGHFIKCVEKLANDDRWANVAVFTPNDVRRMLDVEFISELVVGHLHGMQNKKDKLDDYYEIYEREFEERYKIETIFNIVIGELLSVMPDIELTRWRKKSDFYTLFICISAHVNLLPFSKDQREILRKILIEFADNVDTYLKNPEEYKDASDSVKKYSASVERAASDLASRRARHEVLNDIILEHVING